ncbi:MAG: GNAT family N-acetyltransferase [Verrucomicrobia bacterium]|nr:GNAT family N-acetyltransferase [Verrucomicrobiota bacterium]
MSTINPDHPIRLWRPNLQNVPAFAIPDGLSLKTYSPGCEAWWREIHDDVAPNFYSGGAVFTKYFGSDPEVLGQRMVFFCDGSRPIATATAWYENGDDGESWGRVHFVAVVRDWQGRGVSKALLSDCCARLKHLGHTRACLHTQPARLPAINLYLQFGFLPQLRTPEETAIWCELHRRVKPALRHLLPEPPPASA